MTKWYIVKDDDSGKFADGFYGWDCNIHSEDQIFPDDELPYTIDAPYELIFVGEGDYKPSLKHAQDCSI